MGLVSKPHTFSNGSTILASEHNANFDTLYTLVNGNIEAANIANGAVGENKLATGAVTNDKISSSAAIALSKLASLTANRATATDASGALSASSVTATELGYLSGVTSDVQTQLNSKAETAADVRALGFFDTSNDGSGSGLDADTVDGRHLNISSLGLGSTYSLSAGATHEVGGVGLTGVTDSTPLLASVRSSVSPDVAKKLSARVYFVGTADKVNVIIKNESSSTVSFDSTDQVRVSIIALLA